MKRTAFNEEEIREIAKTLALTYESGSFLLYEDLEVYLSAPIKPRGCHPAHYEWSGYIAQRARYIRALNGCVDALCDEGEIDVSQVFELRYSRQVADDVESLGVEFLVGDEIAERELVHHKKKLRKVPLNADKAFLKCLDDPNISENMKRRLTNNRIVMGLVSHLGVALMSKTENKSIPKSTIAKIGLELPHVDALSHFEED